MTSTLRKRDLRRCCVDGSKLGPWCSRSGCVRAFGEGKSRAVCGSGCVQHVRVGARYLMGEGAIEIDSIEPPLESDSSRHFVCSSQPLFYHSRKKTMPLPVGENPNGIVYDYRAGSWA